MQNNILKRMVKKKNWIKIIRDKNNITRIKYMVATAAALCLIIYIYHLHELNTALEKRNIQLQKEITSWGENTGDYEARKMNITTYAPLDSRAVEGWDFSGDPTITASGKPLIPGETAAAGPNIPFGTRIYVEGMGWYTVKDRGGAIGVNDIDLSTTSKDKSKAFGRQQRLVIIKWP